MRYILKLYVTGKTVNSQKAIDNLKSILSEPNLEGKYELEIIDILMQGVSENYVYRLKICSGHFPMTVNAKDGVFTVKNFIGERIPRTYKLMDNVDVKVEGDIVLVSSPNKEIAGQTAASIEQLCRRPGFDSRIFQDGIYMIEKAGKKVK